MNDEKLPSAWRGLGAAVRVGPAAMKLAADGKAPSAAASSRHWSQATSWAGNGSGWLVASSARMACDRPCKGTPVPIHRLAAMQNQAMNWRVRDIRRLAGGLALAGRAAALG